MQRRSELASTAGSESFAAVQSQGQTDHEFRRVLGSNESRDVTGQVFELEGGVLSIADGWHHGPRRNKHDRWDPAELGPVVRDLLAELRKPDPVYGTS